MAGYGENVVSVQPGAPGPPKEGFHGPPGLAYLTQVDQLLIKQRVELVEAFTPFEGKNKYDIVNSLGQPVYTAKESGSCCTRQCCGSIRPFGMDITDNLKQQVIHIERPLRCVGCCCFCCLQKLEVTSNGELLGTVEQTCSLFWPKYSLKDAGGRTILRIEGPCCQCRCFCCDINFKVYSADSGQEVGKISKQWSGFIKEGFTDADNFGVSFPMELDMKMKAVTLAATFLIDFMYFEENQGGK